MRFKGAGILILELSADPTVFLFAGHRKGRVLFEELGGSIDSGEHVNIAAAREAREESCNALIFDPRSLSRSTHVDLGTYRCFVGTLPHGVPIEDVYTRNRITLHNRHGVNKHYKETFSVSKVHLSDMLFAGIHLWSPSYKPFEVMDVKNKRIQLFNRTSGVLKLLLKDNVLVNATRFKLKGISEETAGPLRDTTSLKIMAE